MALLVECSPPPVCSLARASRVTLLHKIPPMTDKLPKTARRPYLKRLIKLALPHWKPLLIATISLVIGSGIALAYPQAARIVVDDVLGEGAAYDLTMVGFVLLGLFLLQSFFVGLRHYLFSVVGDRIVADLRKALYGAIIGREMGFFDANRTGELTSRLASDTQLVQNAVTTNLSMALRYGVQATGGLIILFITSFRLSLVMIVVLPVVLTIAIGYGRKVRRLSREVQDAIADSTSLAEESIGGIRTVRSFGREAREEERYEEAIERSFDLAKFRALLGGFFGGGVSFLAYGTIAIILWYGGTLVLDGLMTAGELTAYILYVLVVVFSLGALSGLWTDFAKAVGAGERVFGLIDDERLQDNGALEQAIIDDGVLQFEGVHFAYPTRSDLVVLKDITFSLRAGERLAVVGPSGSGKSTIANLLSRFYLPHEGTIRIDGTDISEIPEEELRRTIGMVAQEPMLFSGTIADNVRYGREDASDEEIIAALEAANAWEFVQGFTDGVETKVGERGVRLSGGQKQRVAIARAILKDPRILILDEATSALDVESEHLVQEALNRLMEGRTTVIIAHRLSTIAQAHRVIVLDRGKIIEAGPHQELMELEGLYARMVDMQLLDTGS